MDLPSLACANLLTAGLVPVVEQLPKGNMIGWMLELAHVHDATATEPTMTLLNKERSVADSLAIKDLQAVDAELRRQRQHYGQVLKKVLNQLPSRSLVEVVTTTVARATNHGRHQAPILIDGLVDSQQVAERDGSHGRISRMASQLEEMVRNWDWVAQPIQVSARSRGTDHDLSHKIVPQIRNLAIDLFNNHDFFAIPWKLTALQQEVFAEIPRVVEKSEEDATKFNEVTKQLYKNLFN